VDVQIEDGPKRASGAKRRIAATLFVALERQMAEGRIEDALLADVADRSGPWSISRIDTTANLYLHVVPALQSEAADRLDQAIGNATRRS